MTIANWIELGVGIPTVIIALAAYMRTAVIPVSAATALRDEIAKLRSENQMCREEQAVLRGEVDRQARKIAELESIVSTLRGSEDWWQRRCRDLQDENDNLKRGFGHRRTTRDNQ